MSDRPANDTTSAISPNPRQLEPTLEHIRQALAGLQFGEVSISVQDGVVVQVERIERKRFRRGER
jgi:hypothetical protein